MDSGYIIIWNLLGPAFEDQWRNATCVKRKAGKQDPWK